jgi:mannose-6-phosphate isomerase-like protein (cupin superfamily)
MGKKGKNKLGLVVNPEFLDEYEASEPYQRFMKVLIDGDVFENSPLCMTQVTYPSNAKCAPHFHETAIEVYFVLQGELTAIVNRQQYVIRKGQLIYIPRGAKHFAENRKSKSCRFLAIHVPGVEDVAEVKNEWKKVSA